MLPNDDSHARSNCIGSVIFYAMDEILEIPYDYLNLSTSMTNEDNSENTHGSCDGVMKKGRNEIEGKDKFVNDVGLDVEK